MRKGKLAYLLGLLLAGCGGGGGFTEDAPIFKTVVVHITGTDRNPLEVDVLQKTTTTVQVSSRNQQTQQCTDITTENVCAGATLIGENLTVNFKSDVIKDAAGNPLPALPSPVLVEKYRVSYTGCLSGVYEFSVGQTISPGSETPITIQPITIDMKNQMVQQNQYTYTGNDGCVTNLQVPAYPSICSAVANFEFDLVELTTGKRAIIRYSLPVIFADYAQNDQCTR